MGSRKVGTGVRKYSLLTPTKGVSGEFCGNQESVRPESMKQLLWAVLGKVRGAGRHSELGDGSHPQEEPARLSF